jgi:putative transposase
MAHCNTIFHQVLRLLDRHDFRKIEQDRFRPKRKCRTLSRWGQFVVMMFAQITGRSSLREIVQQFEFHATKLYHLGVDLVKRTTLADANSKRPAAFFEALFEHQYAKCAAIAPRKKFRFKNKLYSFDSTVIDLCLSLFPWAKFRTTKGAIKLHTLVDHDGYIPAFIEITAAKVADLTVAKLLTLPAFSIVVVDRAYVDFAWLYKLTQSNIFFVTRMKRGIKTRVVKRDPVLIAKGLTSDQTIELTGPKGKDCPTQLRRVGYRDGETGQHYVFLTNIFHLSARTIADIYRERWKVELFFKWIKQHLKIKSFLGTSRNAVMTQIWIAIITLLLLAYYKFRAKLGHSLSQILKLLQLNLFSRRNIWHLFDPGPTECMMPNRDQLLMNFGHL